MKKISLDSIDRAKSFKNSFWWYTPFTVWASSSWTLEIRYSSKDGYRVGRSVSWRGYGES